MDTETLVSPSPPKAPITILQSQENGSDDGDSSSHVGEDDDFETASESDSEEPPAVRAAPLLPKDVMPVAKVTADDELDENPSQGEVDGDGPDGRDDISGGGPVSGVKTNGILEGLDEEEGCASTEDGGKGEDLADVIHSAVEEHLEGEYDILEGEAEVENEGVAEDPVAVEGFGETQEQSTVEVEAVEGVSNVSGAEENVTVDVHAAVEEPDGLYKKVDETVDIKAVEGESNVVEAEENEGAELHAAAEEAKAVERVLDEVVEIKAVDRESTVAKAEKNEAADVHAAVEEPKAVERELEEVFKAEENEGAELQAAVEEAKAVERVLDEVVGIKAVDRESTVAKADQNEAADVHAAVEEPKAIERELEEDLEGESNVVEFNENVTAEFSAVEEPKATKRELDENGEGESSVTEVKENEAADLHASMEDLKAIEREVTDVESNNVGAAAEDATADRSLEMVNISLFEILESY